MLDSALKYAARGWRILPLHSMEDGRCTCGAKNCLNPAKHPRTPHGLKDSELDEGTIRAWWARWPTANIGIVTGKVSGVVVLDADRHGTVNGQELLADLQMKHEALPETLSATTGGGGIHYFFQYPADRAVSSRVGGPGKELGRGLDVRADGGYVVAAPSTHATGQGYEWRPGDETVAELPPWLLGLMSQDANRASVKPENDYARLLDGVAEGERNDAAARLAGHYLAISVSAKEVQKILRVWNTHNRPPLDTKELDAVVTSIARKQLVQAGGEVSTPETEQDRVAQLEGLASRFGIDLVDIVRTAGKNPYYTFTVGHNEVQVPAGNMALQGKWATAITAAAERVPHKINKQQGGWAHYANLMMACASHVEPGTDATQAGQIALWKEAYLDQRRAQKNGEVIIKTDPVAHNGKLYVHHPSFQKFVRAEFGVLLSSTQFVQLLADHKFCPKIISVAMEDGTRHTVRMMSVPEAVASHNGPEE